MRQLGQLASKGQIESISAQYLGSPQIALDSLCGAINRLQKAFPRRGHFFVEFIQNADDAGSKSMKIVLEKDQIRICNDGKPFDTKDIESICRVGKSSKTAEDYIGYLGVGFKSIFLISDGPRIHSGTYHFGFQKEHWPEPDKLPWQIIPIWLAEPLSYEKEPWITQFEAQIGKGVDESLLARIRQEVNPDHLSNRMLLFLKHLVKIEIVDSVGGVLRTITKSVSDSNPGYSVYSIVEKDSSETKPIERWLVIGSEVEVPEYVKNDLVTKDWERDTVKKREILIAFKLNQNDELVEEKGTAHIGVFSFVPLKEVPSGLKFLIQGDFLTAPGREVIHREAVWNEWMTQEVFRLIVTKCIPMLLQHDKWKYSLSKILQPGTWEHPLFDQYLKKPLLNHLQKGAILIAEDGSTIEAANAVSINEITRAVLSAADLQAMYPGKKALHPSCTFADSLDVKKAPTSLKDFVISNEGQVIMKSKAKDKNLEWFKKLYSALGQIDKSELLTLAYTPFILTNGFEIVAPHSAFVNLKGVSVPGEIAGSFSLVHSALAGYQPSNELLTKLEVQELTEKHVQDVLSEKEIPAIGKKWESLTESEKVDRLRLLKGLWKSKKVFPKSLGFLTLKTKSGKWLSPRSILFSKEYTPIEDVEVLVEKGVLDVPLEFLTADYASKPDSNEWIQFCKELGVGYIIEDQNTRTPIVQRIGIRVTILYEKAQGRNPEELGESQKPGYDIKSQSGNESRHIEVKGNRDATPTVFVTPKEFVRLSLEKEQYFLYVVTDALRKPVLYSIRGDRIIGADFAISLSSTLWKELSEDEFHVQL